MPIIHTHKYTPMHIHIGDYMVDIASLEKTGESGSERMDLRDVPDEFKGTLVSDEMRVDLQGRNCLYITINYEGKMVTEKYTPMHLEEMIASLQKMGLTDTSQLKGKQVTWKAKTFRIGNPRHFPTK
jgi:hypothetical protein